MLVFVYSVGALSGRMLLVTANAVSRLHRATFPALSPLIVARPVSIDLFMMVALVPQPAQRPNHALHKNAGNAPQLSEKIHVSLDTAGPELAAAHSRLYLSTAARASSMLMSPGTHLYTPCANSAGVPCFFASLRCLGVKLLCRFDFFTF